MMRRFSTALRMRERREAVMTSSRAAIAAASPIRPGKPSKSAGANPRLKARASSTWATGRNDIANARLAASAAIMIKPNAALAGSRYGKLAPDSAMSALYFASSAKMMPTVPNSAMALRPASTVMISIASTTPMLAGHICVEIQKTMAPAAPIRSPAMGANRGAAGNRRQPLLMRACAARAAQA